MKKTDFIIVYEVKKREIEFLTLLKLELEKRGYSVIIDNANRISNVMKPLYHAEVIIEEGFSIQSANFGKGCFFRKALELTSEQIKCKWEIDTFKERDKLEKEKVVSVWGESIRRRLIEVEKMPEDRALALGSIDLDFIKPRFDSFDLSKIDISQKFDLDINKKWALFISSFSLVRSSDDDDDLNLDKCVYDKEIEPIYPYEKKTRTVIRRWFEGILEENTDTIIIYRPHPVEQISEKFSQLERKYSNFRIIRDFSVRQWIKVCDKCYNWYSTSGIQAYFMDKPFYVLRPVEIPAELELENYRNKEGFITDFETFKESYYNDDRIEKCCPFDNSINDYYRFDKNEYTYELVADLCEKIYNSDDYLIPEEHLIEFYKNIKKKWKNQSFKTKVQCWSRRTPFYRLYHYIFSPNTDYPNIIKKEQRELEQRIKKCFE